jgi:uncharacterized OsmC-like protein
MAGSPATKAGHVAASQALHDAVVVTESGAGPYGQRITAGAHQLTADQRARLLDIAERCPVHRMLNSEVVISTTEWPIIPAG